MDTVVLYSYRRCPFAMRVRFALHEKGVPFSIKEEDLKNFSAELKSMHPEAKVPLLVHGKAVIYESAIITEYVEEAFPNGVKLMPALAAERAEVRLWTYWCNHFFKPDLDRFKYGTSRFPESECVGAQERLVKHLQKLEDRLTKHEWLVGALFSLAEIHVFPFCRQLARVNPTPAFLSQFSAVQQWIDKITSREAFKKTIEM